MITIQSPFPEANYADLWRWLNEFPSSNLDDYGPKTESALVEALNDRRSSGETTWGVMCDGWCCGYIGYLPITDRLGSLHGIVFSRLVHGKGIASFALSQVINELRLDGVDKLIASYFADNAMVRKFLRKHGFMDEGYLKQHTVRNMQNIDMRLVAKFIQVRGDN